MGVAVLKVGGRVAVDAVARAIAWREEGADVVVVHGAGPQITAGLEARGVAPVFVGGRRVTTAEALEVVRASMQAVNTLVCEAIGPLAVGLAGDEIGLAAEQVSALGLVGEPVPSAPAAVRSALDEGRIPVVMPLARAVGRPDVSLNVNADEAAAALAVGLGAERIAFLSDVPGVLLDDALVASLGVDEADRMLVAGRFEGGIVPKLVAAVRAARGGVPAQIGATQVVA
jgi:acetylglutamate kinase